MADVSVLLEVQDNMTGALQSIDNQINRVNDSFTDLGSSADAVVDSLSGDVSGAIDRTNDKINEADRSTKDATESVGGLESAWYKVAGVLGTIVGIYSTISWTRGLMDAYDTQYQAELKLQTIMRQRMDANDDMVDSVKKLCSEQQKLGVVGDEVQLAGAQQLATFTNNADALKTLIPAMNNLAVQQAGVNVSSGQMIGLGNMFGKVMQGQVGALSRVGITFDETQAKMLKTGTEMERATVLAQIITDNVGKLNEVMAQTDAGKIQQMKNNWGDVHEVLGGLIEPAVGRLAEAFNNHIPQIQSLLENLVGALSFVVDTLTAIFEGAMTVYSFFEDNWSVLAPLVYGIVGALGLFVGYLALSHAWTLMCTVAQGIFNAVMMANPIILVVSAIMLIIGALMALCNWIADTTGIAQSGLGVITGAFAVAGAFIYNCIVDLINAMLKVVDRAIKPFVGVIEWLVNAFGGGFDSIGDAFANLLGKLISWLLDFAKLATRILDWVFNTDLTSGLEAMQTNLENMGKNENAVTYKVETPKLDRIDYGEAWDAGADLGDKLNQKVTNLFTGDDKKDTGMTDLETAVKQNTSAVNDSADSINANNNKNSKDIKKSVDISKENLVYLRDIAEKDAINQFTTAEIKVDMQNNNTVNNGLDLDSVINKLSNGVKEAMQVCADGVY